MGQAMNFVEWAACSFDLSELRELAVEVGPNARLLPSLPEHGTRRDYAEALVDVCHRHGIFRELVDAATGRRLPSGNFSDWDRENVRARLDWRRRNLESVASAVTRLARAAEQQAECTTFKWWWSAEVKRLCASDFERWMDERFAADRELQATASTVADEALERSIDLLAMRAVADLNRAMPATAFTRAGGTHDNAAVGRLLGAIQQAARACHQRIEELMGGAEPIPTEATVALIREARRRDST